MTNEPSSEDVQCWRAERKAAVVLDLIAGKTTAAEVARSHGLTVSEVEQWIDFITQGTESLRSHPRDLAAQQEAREQQLLAKIGDLTLSVDILKKPIVYSARLAGRDLVKAIHHDLLQEGRHVPWTKLCAVLGVPRSSAYYIAKENPSADDRPHTRKAHQGTDRDPGRFWHPLGLGLTALRRWAPDQSQEGRAHLRLKLWTLKARRAGQRPRVQASRSIAEAPNQR